ncbi:MAG: hypothetical protein JW941_04580, partial [Candidatus Coatesbacteria bacterium]|nr:hypothetical protein [Candidatus Coatesbacteria bacterium]
MRVTRNMMVQNFLTRSGLQYERIDELTNQIASGKRVNRPSDDASGLARIHRYEAAITRIERYTA